MIWKPCPNEDCTYHHKAECSLEVRNKNPRVGFWMKFNTSEHVGLSGYTVNKHFVHPCMVCKHYEPTKFDVYKKEEAKE